jgi:hypothetical protein
MPEPRRIEMRYRPQGPVLERYIAGKARREFIMGPLGSGKTNGSCWKAFRAIIGQAPNREGVRKSRGYAVRNTYPDLMGTTAKDWRDMFGEEFGRFVEGGLEPPTHHMEFNLEDGTRVEAEVVFIALDRPEHVRKIRGSQLTWAWINEVKELNKQIVDMLDLRVGRYPSAADGGPSWFGIFGDTNAPDEDHWYYRLAEEEKPAGWVFHRQPGGVVQVGTGDTISWVPNPGAEGVLRGRLQRQDDRLDQGQPGQRVRLRAGRQAGVPGVRRQRALPILRARAFGGPVGRARLRPDSGGRVRAAHGDGPVALAP